MVKPYEMGDKIETIQGLSDKDLNEYLADVRFLRSGSRQFAIEESNRRKLNKIGKTNWRTWTIFGLIVLTFIFTVLTFFLK